MSVQTELQLAVAQHQTGALQDARLHYLAVLQIEPGHPEANHNMGVLAVQQQQPAAGLVYFLAAIEADPSRGQYWLSYIDALIQAGQTDAARQVLEIAQQQGLQGAEALAMRLTAGGRDVAPEAGRNQPETRRQGKPSAEETNELVTLFGQGDFAQAAYRSRVMTERYPQQVLGWKVLGMALQQMGRGLDALVAMQKTASLSHRDAQAQGNLGVLYKELGRTEDACASFRRALQIKPDYENAHNNLGVALREMGRLDEAAASFRRALKSKPGFADAHNNLGLTLHDLGRFDEACICYRRALQVDSGYAEMHNNLGNALRALARLPDAVASYRQALSLKPDFVAAQNNLGLALYAQGLLYEAEAGFVQALQMNTEDAQAHSNLGMVWYDLGRLAEAEVSLKRALQIKPDFAHARCNLGNTQLSMGRPADAADSYRQALQSKPDFPMAHSNLIFTLDLMTDVDTAFLQAERRRWDVIHAAHLHQHRVHDNPRDPARRLCIAYVSADFRNHSAAYAFGAMLTGFKRDEFDVIAYSNSAVEDEMTRRFQQNVTHFRRIDRLSDDAVADLIRADGVDILVDLSGHSAGNRLRVFARKPAPVQITAWGYAAGTGMHAMDVLFADTVFVPADERQYYAEQVYDLPCAIGYFQPDVSPRVNDLPALAAERVTFGSFNRLVKISDPAYRIWSRILQACPGSRMVLKTPALDDEGTRERVLANFTRAGIDPARILLLGKTSHAEHLAAFSQIDIALDPFPHGGGISALEGLLMGVPLVTLRWPTLTGRVSASIMTTLGLSDWVAQTEEQYVELAIQKANDLPALAEIRRRLRSMFAASILGDQASYVAVAEQAYRTLWQQWCRTGSSRITGDAGRNFCFGEKS